LVTRDFNPLEILSENGEQNSEFGDGGTGRINSKDEFIKLMDFKKTIYFEILDKATNETQILSIPDVPVVRIYKQHMYQKPSIRQKSCIV